MGKITIAIDGYSSCGKSTVAKGVAKKLGYVFIDSGAMYRAVTLYCLKNHIIHDGKFNEKDVIKALDDIHLEFKLNPETRQSDMHLNGLDVEKEIREMNVSNFVSPISAIKEVRDRIVVLQRKFRTGNGIVMDGRDIGTNVFPDAELKIFMTANENVRAQRRWKELDAKGMNVSLEEIKRNLKQRDHEDTHRAYNPLRKAEDAVVLDNTHMSLQEQLDFALKLAKERSAN
jgi:cytidylate kinase